MVLSHHRVGDFEEACDVRAQHVVPRLRARDDAVVNTLYIAIHITSPCKLLGVS